MNSWLDYPGGHRTLLLNPGSCGPRRFYQAITLAILTIDTDGWTVERIEIPHKDMEKDDLHGKDIRRIIEAVVNETKKGRSVEMIASKQKLDSALVEKIVRLYVTHPGVTVEGIMTKMGL